MHHLRIAVSAAAVLFSLTAGVALGQDNALVLLRPATSAPNPCDEATEQRLVTIRDYKIAGKGNLRLVTNPLLARLPVSREAFNRMKKLRLKDIAELEIRDGVMYVSAGEGQKMAAIPDVEPGRGTSIGMAQYLEMALDGETREGRNRQKQMIPLKSVWRLFVLTPSLTMEEALFRHAQQEATVGQWTFYLGKASSHRMKEASDGLSKATTGCVTRALEQFRGGDFRAIERAKELGQRLVAMSGGTGPANDILAGIRKEEQEVNEHIRTGMQLRREQRWDEALTAWESVTAYLHDPSMGTFQEAHAEALSKSHNAHVEAAKAAEQSGGGRGLTFEPGSDTPLRQALSEYEVALKRLPNSAVARQGRREMIIRLALIDARRFRTAKEPGKAHEVLVKLAAEHGEDGRVNTELKEANCELGAQLLDQARALVTVAAAPTPAARPAGVRKRPVAGAKKGASAKPAAEPAPSPTPTYRVRTIQTQADKEPFVNARAKLTQAMSLCAADDKMTLLASVNTALADFHVAQAKKATLRKLPATALLHLNAAQAYQADRSGLEELINQTREPVQQRAQIQAGVVITSLGNDCRQIAEQVASAIESSLVSGGAANVQLLARDQAQAVLRRMRTGTPSAGGVNHAIVSGQIGVCTLNVTNERHQVPSKLQIPNPNYETLRQAADEASQAYNQCKNAYNEQACQQQKNRRDHLRSQFNNESAFKLRDYFYEEQPIRVDGQMRLTLQVDDSILRGTRPGGDASGRLNETCVARRGVQENDWGQPVSASSGATGVRGFLKNLTAKREVPTNTECPQVQREAKLLEMAEQVKAEAQQEAAAALKGVARSYFELAKRATDQELALENYITFTLLSSDKTGADYQQAMNAIRGRDADLKPETALR